MVNDQLFMAVSEAPDDCERTKGQAWKTKQRILWAKRTGNSPFFDSFYDATCCLIRWNQIKNTDGLLFIILIKEYWESGETAQNVAAFNMYNKGCQASAQLRGNFY